MNISYKRKKLKKQLSSGDEIKKNYGNMAKRISQRMDDLRSFPHLAEMIDFPSLNCHKLRGDRQEEWAIKISANYRLIFELDHHPLPINEDGVLDTKAVTDICVIEIVDYH